MTARNRAIPTLADRLDRLDWTAIHQDLAHLGAATTGRLLDDEECADLSRSYDRDELFRSRIVMARHGFGSGEYKYFANPLPPIVTDLRGRLYPPLAEIANGWTALTGAGTEPFPETHAQFVAQCHAAGQTRPTPLLLRYGEGDYNCLHQDLYGPLVFPLQVVFLLDEPGVDFEGGEFVLVEQRPRRQSRAHVVAVRRGEGIVFPVNNRPVQGSKGTYQVKMRHGVSRIRRGRRHTLGIIFHDAA